MPLADSQRSAPFHRQVIEYCQFHVAAEKKDEHGKPAKSEDEIKVGGRSRAGKEAVVCCVASWSTVHPAACWWPAQGGLRCWLLLAAAAGLIFVWAWTMKRGRAPCLLACPALRPAVSAGLLPNETWVPMKYACPMERNTCPGRLPAGCWQAACSLLPSLAVNRQSPSAPWHPHTLFATRRLVMPCLCDPPPSL